MGRDKALLPYRGKTLMEHIATAVCEAAGSVTVIGDPAKFEHLGLRVVADSVPACGPAGGIYTALRETATNWSLIAACDMPGISVEILRGLLREAETADHDCVAATGADGQPEPLCAVYHRRCLPVLTRAIHDTRLKMRDLLKEIGWTGVAVPPGTIANANTPEEWSEFEIPIQSKAR